MRGEVQPLLQFSLREQIEQCLKQQADDIAQVPFDLLDEDTHRALQSVASRFARQQVSVQPARDIRSEGDCRFSQSLNTTAIQCDDVDHRGRDVRAPRVVAVKPFETKQSAWDLSPNIK